MKITEYPMTSELKDSTKLVLLNKVDGSYRLRLAYMNELISDSTLLGKLLLNKVDANGSIEVETLDTSEDLDTLVRVGTYGITVGLVGNQSIGSLVVMAIDSSIDNIRQIYIDYSGKMLTRIGTKAGNNEWTWDLWRSLTTESLEIRDGGYFMDAKVGKILNDKKLDGTILTDTVDIPLDGIYKLSIESSSSPGHKYNGGILIAVKEGTTSFQTIIHSGKLYYRAAMSHNSYSSKWTEMFNTKQDRGNYITKEDIRYTIKEVSESGTVFISEPTLVYVTGQDKDIELNMSRSGLSGMEVIVKHSKNVNATNLYAEEIDGESRVQGNDSPVVLSGESAYMRFIIYEDDMLLTVTQ